MNYNISTSEAIRSLCNQCQFIVKDDSVEQIDWLNTDVSLIPSVESIINEKQRLQEKYDDLEYQRMRKNAYPSMEDQLDVLYHQGYEGWRQVINNVKNKFPKPTVGEQ
jgi:hypothetical protein